MTGPVRLRRYLWILSALISHWRRRPLQVTALVVGLAAATALWSGVQALNAQARASYGQAAGQIAGLDVPLLVPAPSTAGRPSSRTSGGASGEPSGVVELAPSAIRLADVRALRALGWPVSPVTEFRFVQSGASYRVLGVDPLTLPAVSPVAALIPALLGGNTDSRGDSEAGPSGFSDFVTAPYRAYASPKTVVELLAGRSAAPGVPDPADQTQSQTQTPPATPPPATMSPVSLPPLRPSPDMAPRLLVMDIGAAQALHPAGPVVTSLILPVGFGGDIGQLPEDLRGRFVRIDPLVRADIGALTDSFHLNLTAFALLSFLVGLFIVYGAIGLSFEDRKSLFRTLRLCGVSAAELTRALLLELGLFSAFAATLGMLGGAAFAAVLLPTLSTSMSGLYGTNIGDSLTLQPLWWIAGYAISMGGALASSAVALFQTYSMPITHSHQLHTRMDRRRKDWRYQLGAVLVVSAVGLAALLSFRTLAAGFVAMAALLVASALALPLVLPPVLRLLRPSAEGATGAAAGRATARWFWAETEAQIGPMSLSLMALLLALGASIGVGSMVKSFRASFDAFLDERLVAEVFFMAPSIGDANRMVAALSAHPDVSAVLPDWRADARLDGWPVGVVGIRDHATTRQNWVLIDALPALTTERGTTGTRHAPKIGRYQATWGAVHAGAVLVNEQLARRTNLWAGDTVTVDTARGPQRFPIAGVYSDYGNTAGQIRGDADILAAKFPQMRKLGYGVRTSNSSAVLQLLKEQGLDPNRMIDQEKLKILSKSIFERTFLVTTALSSLTMLVAGIALFTNLLTLAGQRLYSLAPLWAMGVPRADLAALDFLKTLVLACLTACVAIPLGMGVAWLLVAVINVEAFGWRLPYGVFPADWAAMFGLVVVTASLAGLWPAVKLARVTPADLAKVFTNER